MEKSRRQLLSLLELNDLSSVVSMVKENRRFLSHLVRIAYDKETVAGWRSIKAVGLAARAIVNDEYPFLREMIRKLLWSLSDESGGIGWSAPEMIGEIVCADPERFQDIIPILTGIYDVEEEVFRPGILYALSRIAESKPELIVSYANLALRALDDHNPLVRYFGLELLSRVKGSLEPDTLKTATNMIQMLAGDRSEVWVYKDSGFINIQIGEVISGM